MPRKTLRITIDEKGKRDSGKVFVITEMPSLQGERWAIKIFLALGRAGISIPEEVFESGIAGVAMMGMQALKYLSYADACPILDEMLQYVTRSEDPAHPEITRALVESDIEEIPTLFQLRKAVYSLNLDFFLQDNL
jgi:hypothetical protein